MSKHPRGRAALQEDCQPCSVNERVPDQGDGSLSSFLGIFFHERNLLRFISGHMDASLKPLFYAFLGAREGRKGKDAG